MSRWFTPQSLPLDTSSPGPQVLAAGLWRCTTSSLQEAFEKIFDPPFRPSMHGSYIFTHVPLLKLCVLATKEESKPKRQKMLRTAFSGYNASSDFPGMAFVDDLIELYPDMKIVLNKRRSRDEWAQSANDNLKFFSTWKYALCCGLIPLCYWHWQLYRQYENLAKRRFGENVDIWGREYYDIHNQWVRDVARRAGKPVLEWEPSMGWKPLCDFIDTDVPMKDIPRANDAEEIRMLKTYLIKRGIAVWSVVLFGAGAIGMAIRRWIF